MTLGPFFAAILCSFAAAAETDGVQLKFENARIHTVGAAHNGIWNLWSAGEAGDYVDVRSDGVRTLSVRAYGSIANGEWPMMGIQVDEAMLDYRVIDSASPKEYSFSLPLKQGLHKLTVLFLNDHVRGREDRNLYLDWLLISPAVSLGDRDAWEAQWKTAQAESEAKTLRAARENIEKVRSGDIVVKVVDTAGKALPNVSVTINQTAHEFLFGCNIFGFDKYASEKENNLYKQRFADIFNYATTGFYWRSYEPEQGKPRYAETDKIAAWCAEHGITLKGHPLLWDHQAAEPAWSNGQPDAKIQERRVREIISRYKDRISYWEVVNEPAHLNGVSIDAPYKWARETDPKGHLIINDYGVMANGYPPFFELLKSAIARGVPFDGIGIQSHEPRTMRFPLAQVQATLDRYATLGKAIHITEFTPTSAGALMTGPGASGEWDEAAQADYAVKFYTVCFAHPAVAAITWWDLCDAQSWLEGGGLLRKDLSAKPAYAALRSLIRDTWHTTATGTTDDQGELRFRGFYGKYTLEGTANGKRISSAFQVSKTGTHTAVVTAQ